MKPSPKQVNMLTCNVHDKLYFQHLNSHGKRGPMASQNKTANNPGEEHAGEDGGKKRGVLLGKKGYLIN